MRVCVYDTEHPTNSTLINAHKTHMRNDKNWRKKKQIMKTITKERKVQIRSQRRDRWSENMEKFYNRMPLVHCAIDRIWLIESMWLVIRRKSKSFNNKKTRQPNHRFESMFNFNCHDAGQLKRGDSNRIRWFLIRIFKQFSDLNPSETETDRTICDWFECLQSLCCGLIVDE